MTLRSLLIAFITAVAAVLSLAVSAMPAGAALFTPTISTTVFDASVNGPWLGIEVTGASAYDTSTVTGDGIVTPSGTVTYSFFSNGTCAGTATSTQTVTLAGGTVPNSASQGPLAAGSYSFEATYNGDVIFYGPASGSCDPIVVGPTGSTTSTTVHDASTNGPWSGTEVTGASAYDTSTVTAINGIQPTGSSTYSFFSNGTCAGTATSTQTVTLAGGFVPNSSSQGPLAAGTYSFDATYNGDSNYNAGTNSCEPFTVGPTGSTTSTTVYDASTNGPWSGTEVTGASAYDTSTVTAINGIQPTGSSTYSFFSNGTCAGTATSTQTVTLAGGFVPNSSSQGPLAAGTYSFDATYNGDSNYNAGTNSCEPFTVGPTGSTTSTTVYDASTNGPWSGTEVTGASAYDTSTVIGVSGFTPTGTLTYSFFANGTCLGTAGSTQTVTLAGGIVSDSAATAPLAVGSYSYQATYSGDANYNPSPTSGCETFRVKTATPGVTTTVFDAAINAAWTGGEATGAAAYDTASVSGVSGFTPTGTVSYQFFTNFTCSGSPAPQTVTLSGGLVPHSPSTASLGAGPYSFDATYSGDANYNPSPTSGCETFRVKTATPGVTTTVFDAAINAAWTGGEATGAAAYDTASVSGVSGFTPTGTVTYSFFANGTCLGTAGSTQTVTLAGGIVSDSAATAPLAVGSYSYQATYSGDANYSVSAPSGCEPFTVNKGTPLTSTTVFDANTNGPWSGNEVTGAAAYDTSTLTPTNGINPTGTVTYSFFSNGTCTAPPTTTPQTVTLSSGAAPHSSLTPQLNPGTLLVPSQLRRRRELQQRAGRLLRALHRGPGPFHSTELSPTSHPPPSSAVDSSAAVNTNGDGVLSVSSNSTDVCIVGATS